MPLPFLVSPVDKTYPAPEKIAPKPSLCTIGGRPGRGGITEVAKNNPDRAHAGYEDCDHGRTADTKDAEGSGGVAARAFDPDLLTSADAEAMFLF